MDYGLWIQDFSRTLNTSAKNWGNLESIILNPKNNLESFLHPRGYQFQKNQKAIQL